jgi:alkanesulfonate monooxygenase SsuD/methylene tetrahydromethanopterin reductase-like flavin-dependent oxidoreductase (luciferase family)
MSEVEREEARLCEEVGLPAQSLADCAYVLVGPPQAMAEKLQRLVAEVGATRLIAGGDVPRFLTEVAPLLG